jgi:hypothetical protein
MQVQGRICALLGSDRWGKRQWLAGPAVCSMLGRKMERRPWAGGVGTVHYVDLPMLFVQCPPRRGTADVRVVLSLPVALLKYSTRLWFQYTNPNEWVLQGMENTQTTRGCCGLRLTICITVSFSRPYSPYTMVRLRRGPYPQKPRLRDHG